MQTFIKRKLFLTVLSIICCCNAIWAQDIITMKNGNEIQAKVLEVGTHDVKYKKFENQEGPIYTALKAEIFMIKYQNGEKDVFSQVPLPENTGRTVSKNENPITKTGDGVWKPLHFYDKNGNRLSRNEVRKYLSKDPMFLNTFNKGCRQIDAGNAFGGIGVGIMAAGLGVLIPGLIQDNFELKIAGYLVMGGGALFLIPAITLPAKGSKNVHDAINWYNNMKVFSLNFGITNTGGVGLVLKF